MNINCILLFCALVVSYLFSNQVVAQTTNELGQLYTPPSSTKSSPESERGKVTSPKSQEHSIAQKNRETKKQAAPITRDNQTIISNRGEGAVETTPVPSYPPATAVTQNLHKSIRSKNLELAQMFIDQGADINCQSCWSNGLTALMSAAGEKTGGRRPNPMLEWLINRGAAVNAKDIYGNTALHIASQKGFNGYWSHGADLLYLIDKGADVKLVNNKGLTPLQLFIGGSKYPGKYERENGWPLEQVAYEQQLYQRIVKKFIEYGGNINLKNSLGVTPFYETLKHCEPEGIEFFISVGADKAVVTDGKKTAYEIALETAMSTSSKACNEVVRILGGGRGGGSVPQVSIGTIIRDCDQCPEMVVVPKGTFSMGGAQGQPSHRANELPRHVVTIGKAFAIGKTEITRGQWKRFMGPLLSVEKCGDNCPVMHVSWNEAREFAKKLSTATGKVYRLPSESEWEYACRAGEDHLYCGGNDVQEVAWFSGNHNSSSYSNYPVARRKPNAWGIYDMSGNALEWVEDCWHDDYSGAPMDGSAWVSQSEQCNDHVTRGGSFLAPHPRAAWREKNGSFTGLVDGFRLVREID